MPRLHIPATVDAATAANTEIEFPLVAAATGQRQSSCT